MEIEPVTVLVASQISCDVIIREYDVGLSLVCFADVVRQILTARWKVINDFRTSVTEPK